MQMALGVDAQVGLRLPAWLRDDLVECAARSGWTLSDQIRYELEGLRGKARTPYMPQPTQHQQQMPFNAPIHDGPSRKARRNRRTR